MFYIIPNFLNKSVARMRNRQERCQDLIAVTDYRLVTSLPHMGLYAEALYQLAYSLHQSGFYHLYPHHVYLLCRDTGLTDDAYWSMIQTLDGFLNSSSCCVYKDDAVLVDNPTSYGNNRFGLRLTSVMDGSNHQNPTGLSLVVHGSRIDGMETLQWCVTHGHRLHVPTNLWRQWLKERADLAETVRYAEHATLWSTIHDEHDVELLQELDLPELEAVLISPIFPTQCKVGHPGIGVDQALFLGEIVKEQYPNIKSYALGGVHPHQLDQCKPFAGVAMMSELMARIDSRYGEFKK